MILEKVKTNYKGKLMPTKSRFVKLGQPAPDFSLPSVDGGQTTLKDFRGEKNVVLVFLRGFM
jgi:peroxiredoxin (alkyl hydroperoxide reductase subunit C)